MFQFVVIVVDKRSDHWEVKFEGEKIFEIMFFHSFYMDIALVLDILFYSLALKSFTNLAHLMSWYQLTVTLDSIR